jgi:TatA/E family protein of Tat protein translocase
MPNIGVPELVIILVIALLILGPGRLPDVASSLGKSIKEFRKAASDVQESASLTPTAAAPAPLPAAPSAAVAPEAPEPAVPAPNTLAAAAEPNTLVAAAPPADAAAEAPAVAQAEPVVSSSETQA